MTNVSVHDLQKSFSRKKVLSGVSLSVEQGQFLTLLGSSGCGKTTTLRCIAGLETPDGGEIKLGEKLIFGGGVNVPARRRELGMVFQSYALWPNMTVADNVAFGLHSRKQSAAARTKRVEEILEVVGLAELRAAYPFQLSGGQQQRVGLARALAYEPQVLLLDEPLSNLDASLRDQLRLEIRRIQRASGITALYVTHDTREALSMSDSICLMRSGRIVHQSAPEELWRSPGSAYAAAFLNAGTLVDGVVASISGTSANISIGHEIVAADIAVGDDWRSGDQCAVLIRNASLVPIAEPTDAGANVLTASVLITAVAGDSRETDVLVGEQRIRVITPVDRWNVEAEQLARLEFQPSSSLVLRKD